MRLFMVINGDNVRRVLTDGFLTDNALPVDFVDK